MRYSVLLTGTGGQGVLSAGKILAECAANLAHSTFVPWYGAAQRGGVAKCTVVLSNKEILSPLPGLCNAVIATSDEAVQRAPAELAPSGILVRNSDVSKSRIKAGGFSLMNVPANDLASQTGSARNSTIVLLGALLGSVGVLPKVLILKTLDIILEGREERFVKSLEEAFKAGFEYGSDKSHIVFLEPKSVSNSRYSTEKTTVGEMLDTPEIRALVEEIFPQVLSHPLIEAGRTFKFIDAVPYMKDMITEEELETFAARLEELK